MHQGQDSEAKVILHILKSDGERGGVVKKGYTNEMWVVVVVV